LKQLALDSALINFYFTIPFKDDDRAKKKEIQDELDQIDKAKKKQDQQKSPQHNKPTNDHHDTDNPSKEKDKAKKTDYALLINELPSTQKQPILSQIQQTLSTWLQGKYKKIEKLSFTTHPIKLSHPDAKATNINMKRHEQTQTYPYDGYLHTGHVNDTAQDISGSAALIPLAKFLVLKLADGQSMMDHLQKETTTSQQQFDLDIIDYDDLCEQISITFNHQSSSQQTSRLLKQVYFPVHSAEKYHLLSIVSPSGIMAKLQQRIQQIKFSDKTKIARNAHKKNEPPPQDQEAQSYRTLSKLAKIKYGGTQPQNISLLNSNMGGHIHLLLSLPPVLKAQQVRKPKKDFFKLLYYQAFAENFKCLYRCLLDKRDNMLNRQKFDQTVLWIFDKIVHQVWQIRKAFDKGWSTSGDDDQLPIYQKIILDDHWQSTRQEEPEHIKQFIEDIARWMSHSTQFLIKYLLNNKKKQLANDSINKMEKKRLASFIDQLKTIVLGDDFIHRVTKIMLKQRDSLR